MTTSITKRFRRAGGPQKAAANPQAGEPAGSLGGPRQPPADGWNDKVRAHRHRQGSVAKILERLFGKFTKAKPELWEHRAYLMLVGMVYERLVLGEFDLSTDELVALSKVLATHRRAEAQRNRVRASEDSEEPASSPKSTLPARWGEVVRQLYGTSVCPGIEERRDEK